jgi:hypothetical protein
MVAREGTMTIINAMGRYIVSAPAVLFTMTSSGSGAVPLEGKKRLCTPDAFRLCSSEIPNVDHISVLRAKAKSQSQGKLRKGFRQATGARCFDEVASQN